MYSVDVAIEKPRTAHRMTHWTNAGEIDDSAMQYIKVNVFFPFIDHCLMQSDQRFPADKTDMFLASKLMSLTIATMRPAEITRVFGWYSADLPLSSSSCVAYVASFSGLSIFDWSGNIDPKPGMSHYIPCLIAE